MSLKSFLFTLVLACVVALPVTAASNADTAPAPVTLAVTLLSTDAPLVQASLPGPGELSGCHVELECPATGTISCDGNYSCSAHPNLFFISCDGSPTYCPCYGSVCWDGSDPTCVCWCLDSGGGSMRECRMECKQECPPITP